jgi:hypothetical protein
VAEPPAYDPDAAIMRLLAAGPLPTRAIAGALGMPARTTRHRVRQLRRSGAVTTGNDGFHRLADPGAARGVDQGALVEAPSVASPNPEEVRTRTGTGLSPEVAQRSPGLAVIGLAATVLAVAAAWLRRGRGSQASTGLGRGESSLWDGWGGQ